MPKTYPKNSSGSDVELIDESEESVENDSLVVDSEREDSYYDISENTFDSRLDAPLTWLEAQKAENHYQFQSQLMTRAKGTTSKTKSTQHQNPSSQQTSLDAISKITDWGEFLEYRDQISECLDETRRSMKQLLANNLNAYVRVELFNREEIRNRIELRHDSWSIIDSTYASLSRSSEQLYGQLIDRLHNAEDIDMVLAASNGKWKKLFALRDEVRSALKLSQYPKIVSAYKRYKIFKKQNTSTIIKENFFPVLDKDFQRTKTILFEIVTDYSYPFVDREQCIRYLRDLEFNDPDPGQYTLVAEFKRFQRRIYQSKSDYMSNYFELLLRTGSTILDEHTEISGPSLTKSLAKSRREIGFVALRELCENLVDELLEFLKTCNVTLTHPDFINYKKEIDEFYDDYDGFSLIIEEPMTEQRQASILRLCLYSKTFDPLYLTHLDQEEEMYSNTVLPVKVRTSPVPRTLGDTESTIVVALVCAEGTSRVSMDILPRITADEFIAQCQAQFAYENEEINDVHDLVLVRPHRNPVFIFGDRSLFQFSYLFTCFNKGQRAELLMVRKSDALFPSPSVFSSNFILKYHRAFDLLTETDMLDHIANIFQKRCKEFFDCIDDGTSYQPRLFGSMEHVIATTERFVNLLTMSGLTVNSFEECVQTSRYHAIDTAVQRFVFEIKHLSKEEDWLLIGDHTHLPVLFYEKCIAFIDLMREIVSSTQEELVTSSFLSFFKTYTATYNKLMLRERKQMCESAIHIAQLPYFKQLLIVVANIEFTLQHVCPKLMKRFETLFGMQLREKKTIIKSELNETLQSFRMQYIEGIVGRMKRLCDQHLDNLRDFVPLPMGDAAQQSSSEAFRNEESRFLPTSSMKIIMRFNSTILHEFTLIYSNIELIGLEVSPILNPVIHLVTEYLKEKSHDVARTHMHIQCMLWNHLFVETRNRNDDTRRLINAWLSEFPHKKIHTRYLHACQREIAEHPYFSET
uniref:Exocyst complex component EXOC2/Sec5 N-terminal domain-containing protein n=1 Tax=Percolomonas cosmopolitus TaxID=63605 RepID=A0A7S1PHA7_9EUKA